MPYDDLMYFWWTSKAGTCLNLAIPGPHSRNRPAAQGLPIGEKTSSLQPIKSGRQPHINVHFTWDGGAAQTPRALLDVKNSICSLSDFAYRSCSKSVYLLYMTTSDFAQRLITTIVTVGIPG
jgi:hypothetical protein